MLLLSQRILYLNLLIHILGVKNGAVVRFEDILADSIEIFGKIIGMAGKIHARLTIRGGIPLSSV